LLNVGPERVLRGPLAISTALLQVRFGPNTDAEGFHARFISTAVSRLPVASSFGIPAVGEGQVVVFSPKFSCKAAQFPEADAVKVPQLFPLDQESRDGLLKRPERLLGIIPIRLNSLRAARVRQDRSSYSRGDIEVFLIELPKGGGIPGREGL
jgi:hypothetical protein